MPPSGRLRTLGPTSETGLGSTPAPKRQVCKCVADVTSRQMPVFVRQHEVFCGCQKMHPKLPPFLVNLKVFKLIGTWESTLLTVLRTNPASTRAC